MALRISVLIGVGIGAATVISALAMGPTPEQKAASAALAVRQDAIEAKRRKVRAEYEAYWGPIVENNQRVRAYDLERCKDRGLMIPDNGRYREFLIKCMAGQGYQFSGPNWFAGWESNYAQPKTQYSL